MWMQDCFFRWWLRGPRYGWSKFRRFLFERGYLKNPLPPAKSLSGVRTHLKKITWTQDGFAELFDCVSYPQRVWARKKDDCDGFAVLACALLKQWDEATDPVIVTAMVSPVKHGHSVCVFKVGTAFRYFSNSVLKPTLFSCYASVVADFVNPNHHLACWDVTEPDTLKQREFHSV